MKAIGIDIGTTSVCGIVIDVASGKAVRSITKNSNAFLPAAAEWEKIQSVEKIMTAAMGILQEFTAAETDIAVIGVTGQMHGIVYTDENGKAVSPLYTWQDGRGNLPYNGTTYAKHLNSFAGYGNVTDFYNVENGIRPKTAVSYCTIHDYFVMQLCGLKKPVMHASDAASFGCYDIVTNTFSYPCNAEVAADYRIAGRYQGIPVSVAIGDNQASVFSTLTKKDYALLNIGTGSQVSVISSTPVAAENVETRPYFEGKYLVVGSALCGGRAYSLLKDFYMEILNAVTPVSEEQVYGVMNAMLGGVEPSLTVDTRFAGTRSNAQLTGGVYGLTTQNFKPAQLTMGVLEGIVQELYEMYQKMGVQAKGIVGSGNGVRKNAALVRTFEKRFGAKMAIPCHLEEASFGAALFGLIAAGVFKNAEEAQSIIRFN